MSALGFTVLLAMSFLFSASAILPRSYFELTVYVNDQESPKVDLAFVLTDPLYQPAQNMEAATVSVTATVGPELAVNGTAGGSWSAAATNVAANISFDLKTYVTPAVQQNMSANPGTTIFSSVFVTARYTDYKGNGVRTIQRTVTFALNYRAPSNSLFLAAAVAMGLGGAGVIGLSVFVLRRARLNELYLMHDSGMLIRHWSRDQHALHDSDIMSGMLIVLQEFVRDTWKAYGQADESLQELRFGPRRVLLARGDHAVLAAVVQGRYLNGLPKKLQEAVQDFEASHEGVLRDWNGNLALLSDTDHIAHRFLKGRARAA